VTHGNISTNALIHQGPSCIYVYGQQNQDELLKKSLYSNILCIS